MRGRGSSPCSSSNASWRSRPLGKLLDRLKVLPLARRKNALLFDALKRAEAERQAARITREAIAEAAETPAEDGETPTPPLPAK